MRRFWRPVCLPIEQRIMTAVAKRTAPVTGGSSGIGAIHARR
jgi:hypothetical protein